MPFRRLFRRGASLHRERGLCTGEHHRHRQPQRRIHRFRTLDDPEPEIHTTAYDASDSDHYIGVGTVKVTDKVEYSHLVAGKTYTVTGEVHDAKTGDVLKVNGKTVTAEKTFTAEESHGSVTVDFSFDNYDLAGKTLVVYETPDRCEGREARRAQGQG